MPQGLGKTRGHRWKLYILRPAGAQSKTCGGRPCQGSGWRAQQRPGGMPNSTQLEGGEAAAAHGVDVVGCGGGRAGGSRA